MTPIVIAVKRLLLLRPEYFQKVPGRVPSKGCTFPRPNLRTDSTFDTLSVREAVTPVGMASIPVGSWREWYHEVAEEFMDTSLEERRMLAVDLAARASLNARQGVWFLPRPTLNDVLGPTLLLNFCLCGALIAGAKVVELSPTNFVLTHDDVEWGISGHVETGTDRKLYPLPYSRFVAGGFGRNGATGNAALVRAYAAAERAKDTPAKEILAAVYWNIPENARVDALLSTGNQGEQ